MSEKDLGSGDCRVFQIGEIKRHPNADSLGIVDAGGYQVVVRLADFKPGDRAVHVSPDTMLPEEGRYAFVQNKRTMAFGDVQKSGYVVKTVKLRGEISEGLCLPFPEGIDVKDGANIADALGALHYQKPIPVFKHLPGEAPEIAEYFPRFIPKTDSTRMETLIREEAFPEWGYCLVTEKIDGTSMTVYRDEDGPIGVCSRNLILKEGGDLYWTTAKKHDLSAIPPGVALQGEIAGPGIQGNPLGLDAPTWFLFDAFLIRERRYSGAMLAELSRLVGAARVPVIGIMQAETAHAAKDGMMLAGLPSLLTGKEAEGLVYTLLKRNHPSRVRFKVMNPRYVDGA